MDPPIPLSPGALVIVSPREGESSLGSPMEWMAHKYAGQPGIVVDVIEQVRVGGVRVYVLGAVRTFSPRNLDPVRGEGE